MLSIRGIGTSSCCIPQELRKTFKKTNVMRPHDVRRVHGATAEIQFKTSDKRILEKRAVLKECTMVCYVHSFGRALLLEEFVDHLSRDISER